MNIDWVSPELKGIIEMAIIAHELDHDGDFWPCKSRGCVELRAGITKSIDMEAKIMAVRNAEISV